MRHLFFVSSLVVCAHFLMACNGRLDGDAVVDAGHHDTALPDATPIDSGADDDAGALVDAAVPRPVPRVCSEDNWCWEQPRPQGEDVRALWANDVANVWAVGANGLIIHNDGTGWTRAPQITDVTLNAVFGIAADDIWAAGDTGVVLHFNGAQWSVVSTAPSDDTLPVPTPRTLRAIWGASADDIWFAGDNGRLFHFDGDAFTITPGANTNVSGLWGSASDNVWAVGNGGTIQRFDGTTWSTVVSNVSAALFAIHGLGENDIWAIGNRAATHWDGTTWTDMTNGWTGAARAIVVVEPLLPSTDAGTVDAALPDAGIADASADAATDASVPVDTTRIAWAFGDDGKVWAFANNTWSPVASNLTENLYAATTLADDDLLVSGERGVLQRWTQGARQTLSSGTPGARLNLFVDHNTLLLAGDGLVQHNSAGWSKVTLPVQRALYGIWGDDTDVWAVGTAGTVLHRVANVWSDVSPPTAGSTWLRSVHGAGNSTWIVGNDGLALTRAAGSWIASNTPGNTTLRDVWGFGDADFWAVGDDATALHWNGSQWRTTDTKIESASLRAVWGDAPDNVWAVGSLGTVIHWNGTVWSTSMGGGAYSLDDVIGHEEQLWAVGNAGTVLHFNGETWNAERSGTTRNLHTITIDQDGVLWAAGDLGTVLSKRL